MLSRFSRIASKQIVKTPVRGIKLYEYQAGALLSSYKVNIPIGDVAFSVDEVRKIAAGHENGCVVKSQVLAGGRGMGHIRESGFKGGVKVVNNADEAAAFAGEVLGKHLVTK